MKSKASYFISIIVILYAGLIFYPRWEKTAGENCLGWDVSGYYWYLPSLFIYHDIKHQGFADSVLKKYEFTPGLQQASKLENGNYVLTYSSGMAVMYSPFFFAAHILSKPLGYPDDGFSKPYQLALFIGSLLVACIGLWYLRKLLLHYYSDKTVALLLLLLTIGSNYLNYTAIDGTLSHNWLFTLYVFLLLATRSFYNTYQSKYAIAIGFLCGLLTLARPSEMISALIPILWGLETISKRSIADKIGLLKQQWKNIALALITGFMVCSVQLIYWKYVSGHWLVYSYGDQGFYWTRPHFRDYIFSYKSGWLTYTPMLILSFIGIIPFLKHGKNKVAILCFFFLNLYIVSAWDIWWYAGSGGRAMIQSYPILLFPFASFIEFIGKTKFRAWVATPFILLFIYINIWFTYNAHAGEGVYDAESMNKAFFWRVIGRWHLSEQEKKLKDTDELFEGIPENMQLIYENDFESDSSKNAATNEGGNRTVHVDKENIETTKWYFQLKGRQSKWIRAEASFYIEQIEWTAWKMPALMVQFHKNSQPIKSRIMRPGRYIRDGKIRRLFLDVKIPQEPFDSISVHLWNPGTDIPVVMDDLKVWEFR